MSLIDRSANLNRWRNKALAEKSLFAFGMLVIAVAVPSWESALLVAAIVSSATLLGARVDFSVWWKAMTAPVSFLAIGIVTILFQLDGWHISLAPHGLELAGRLAARALAGISCLLFLGLTTPATDLVAGSRRIGVPTEITEMALLMYRFVFLLLDTVETMHTAQAARLGHISKRRQLNSLSLLIANLLPRAFARAHALEVGLAARGWHGELRVLSPVRRGSALNYGMIIGLELIVLTIGLRLT